MNSTDEAFSPPAELARLHIRVAVTCLLEHPPVQGQKAIDGILADLRSPYFPSGDTKAALARLRHSPLSRPKPSLVRNIVIVIVKELLGENLGWEASCRFASALNAIREMHRATAEAALRGKLPDILRHAIRENKITRVVRLAGLTADIWEMIPADVVDALVRYVEAAPSSDAQAIGMALLCPPLADGAEERIRREDESFLLPIIRRFPHRVTLDRAIELVTQSKSFDTTNGRIRSLLLPQLDLIGADQARRVFAGAQSNSQVRYAHELRTFVRLLREGTKVEAATIDSLISEHSLPELLESAGEHSP